MCARLDAAEAEICGQYRSSEPAIGHFIIDDLLPAEIALNLAERFPVDGLTHKKSLRERKSISAQMDRHDSLVEEALFAFQDPRVVARIAQFTGATAVEPDGSLYAGGVSAMGQGDFLNPHIDNSHDKDRQAWRVFNLLYYCTTDWTEADGGSLELWPEGGDRVGVPALFNRLVVMATHGGSWHSVSPVTNPDRFRRCISNYYFSPEPLRAADKFHVTSFRGRPEQRFVDALLRGDSQARGVIRKLVPGGVRPITHVYEH